MLNSQRKLCHRVPGSTTQSVIRYASSPAHLQLSRQFSGSYVSQDATSVDHALHPWADALSSHSGSPSLSSAESDDPAFNLSAGSFGVISRSSENASSSSGNSGQIVRFPGRSTIGNESMEIFNETMLNCFARSSYNPSMMDKYWEVIRARNTTLENTIACVTAAYQAAYGDQISKFSHLMISALRDGLVPHQPQATPLRTLRLVAANMEDLAVRLIRFASLLPGFRDLLYGDQRILLSEKHLISNLLHLAKYFYRGDYYFTLVGPDNVHCCRSVIDCMELDPDFVRFAESSMACFNSIGLTLPETYLLLAAAVFYPEVTTAVNKTLMEHLHSLYMDALFYSVGRRLGVGDRAVVYAKVQKGVSLFPLIDKASMNYVQSLNVTVLPMHPRAVAFKECVTK